MKILITSDTHENHKRLPIIKTDMVIHAGDAANHWNPTFNANPMDDFLIWLNDYPAKWKIFVPGNHDTSIYHGLVNLERFPAITPLINQHVTINGLKFYGSPYTPVFGKGWSWMKERFNLRPIWENIPDDTDILITHGPPKYILDMTTDKDGLNGNSNAVHVGCKALYNRVIDVNPKFHIFGHVHDEPGHINFGIRKIGKCDTVFMNASFSNIRQNKFNNWLEIEV